MPWLSVLVPVYNVQPYLRECVASIVNQLTDEDNVQILLLDDCSSDGSWALMNELAAHWPGRLQLLQHERNRGLSAARNTMIDAARGDYLWFLDSDDKLLPDSVKSLRTIVKTYEPDVVLCDFSVWRERLQLKHRLRGEHHRRSFKGPAKRLVKDHCTLIAGMLSTGQLHAWSKISRRSLWATDLRFPVGQYFEDMTALPLMGLRAQSFYYEPAPWIAYRQRATSILSTMSLRKAMHQSAALLPVTHALRNTSCYLQTDVQWALAQQAARSMIGALRYVCQPGALPEAGVNLSHIADQIRQNFLEISPLSPNELARAYFRRGWWLRRRRFLRWYAATPHSASMT